MEHPGLVHQHVEQLLPADQRYGLKSWVAEHCPPEYGAAIPARANWAYGLDGATHLYRAVVNGRVNSWSYWTIYRRDADKYNSGYGHSLWYSESTDGNATLKPSGHVSALTPFFRYVRPGYKRVAATPSDTSTTLRVTAFKAPGGVNDGLVIVVINRGTSAVDVSGSIAAPGSIVTLQRCVAAEYTSGGVTRHSVRGGQSVTISGGFFNAIVPAKSVTAFVHEAGSPWPTADFDDDVSGLGVSVDAAPSTPSTIDRYEWDFGDGSIAEGITASHQYAAAGTYTVTLTVTEQKGGVNTTSRSVTVSDPVGDLSGSLFYYRTADGQEPSNKPVGNATLNLQGQTVSKSTTSDPATGGYSFQDLPRREHPGNPDQECRF